MRVLVTGCRGFIAEAVARACINAGHEVCGVARTSQPEASWRGIYVSADVAHADLTKVIVDFAPDVVFHGAGTASVGASMTAPLEDLRGAVLTWANVLDSIRRSGRTPQVVFPSSAAVYGNPRHLPVSEEAVVGPVSPYGFHKAACELLAREYAECFGLRIVVCRLFSVFGPRQRRLLVWELYKQFTEASNEVWLEGTGEESRDYLNVDDVGSAIEALMRPTPARESQEKLQIVNVASGQETSVWELAESVGRAVGTVKPVRSRGRQRPGDPMRWVADTRSIRSAIPDWRPRPLSAGLMSCAATWREANPAR